MKDFAGKLAVITGGGTGMGRALAQQLVAEGCDVAICDVIDENMQRTLALCQAEAPQGIKITAHQCDVSLEEDVNRFRDDVLKHHQRDHINLLFNNAGIASLTSFINGPRDEWERTFNVCWNGVYFCARAFMPLLVASEEGHIINTSSVNGFWASVGPSSTHTAYSAAKFAVKGFSEALINDLRINAPHVKVSVVMPGHIGTSIIINSSKIMGRGDVQDLGEEEIASIRKRLEAEGIQLSDDEKTSSGEIQAMIQERAENFRDNAPMSAEEAAAQMLQGVKDERWRILLGKDAEVLDRLIRSDPESAYETSFMEKLQAEAEWGLGD